MSKLSKLKFINNTSKAWKIMFELYDWIRWSNEAGEDTYAEYFYFMKICDDELLRMGLDPEDVPRVTTNENWCSRWFHLDGNFKNMEDMKHLLDHDAYNIFMVRGKIQVRWIDGDTNKQRNK